ncbi:MAG: PEGA domain-containing protein, partial [Candidatus Andersenbacteria bacterium]
MHLTIRRLMSIVAFIAFLAIAPVIILYAIGYRSVTTTIPQPVGVVVVNAFPKKSTATVNGTDYGTVPRSIPNLLPGMVDIAVAKDGYQSWQKKLEIKPMQATDARAIRLIPTTPDTDVISSNTTLFSVSNDATTIAIATSKNEVFITDQNGKFKTNSIPLKSAITHIAWSSDSTHILVETKNSGFAVLEFSNQAISKLPFTLPATDTHVTWDPASSTQLIALTKNRELIRYNTVTHESKVEQENVNNYTFTGNQLIFQKIDNTLTRKNNKVELPGRATLLVSSGAEDILAIVDSGELVLVDKNNVVTSIAPHAITATFSPDGSFILFQPSNNELDIYNINNDHVRAIPIRESHVLTRLIQPITGPTWLS